MWENSKALSADLRQRETPSRKRLPRLRLICPLFCIALSLFGQASDPGAGAPRTEQASTCLPVLANLDGWYDFDALTSPTPGVGGLGPDAVWFGNPVTVPGLAGAALRFDGASFLEVVNSTAFNYPSQNFSVNLWIRTTASGKTFLDKRCLGTAGGCATPQGWALAVSPVGYLQLLMGSALPYFYEGFSAYELKKINDGEWHFISVSVDRAAGRVVFAVDPQSETDDHLVSIEGYAGAIASVRPLRIGGDQTSPVKFTGDLDEVQIYGRALSVAEVLSVQSAGPAGQCRPPVCSPVSARKSLVGWYSFEETSGVIWQDRAGQNNYLAGTAEQVNGQTGSAAQFARVPAGGGLRTIDGAPELDMGTGNFTIAAWIRYFPASGGRRAIVDKQGDDASATTGAGGGYALMLDGGYLRLSMTPAGMPRSAASAWVANGTRLDDGRWHQVAAVVDRARATPELYVDGKLESYGPGRGSMVTASINSGSPLNVGGFSSEVSETVGAIDELTIFNAALTPGDVQTIVDAAGTGYCRRNDQGCIAPPAGLISWYRFENATGAFDDAGVVPNEPLVVAGAASRGSGRVGRGVRLPEGTSSLRTLGATPKLNFDTGPFSFAFWIQPGPGASGTGAGSRTILEKMTYTSPPNTVRATQGYRVRLVNGRLELAMASGGNLGIWTGNTTLRANQWAMIAVTIARDGSPVVVYVNGKAESLAAAGITPAGSLATPSPVVVGLSADLTLNPIDPVAFDFDELSYYSRVLSLAEAQALAQANVGQCFEGQVSPVKPVFEVSTSPESIGVTVGVSGDSSAVNAYATTIAPSAITTTPAFIQAALPNGMNDPGTEYRFRDWSLNGVVNPEWNALVQTVPLPTQATSYTANYDTYHRITATVTGNCRVTPFTGLYLAGSSRDVAITLPAGWVVTSATWTVGAFPARAVSQGTTLTLTGPSTLAVVCRDATLFPITVSTSPANVGLQVIADGNQVNNSQTFSWPSFPARILSVFPQGQVVGLTQYTFRRWRNAATNATLASAPLSQVVVLPTAPASYIADFDRTAFQILVRQTTGCVVSVSPSPNAFGFYPAGTRLTISSSASSGYAAGPLTIQPSLSSAPITRLSPTDFVLDGPISITGQCDPQVTTVRFNSAPAGARLSMTFLSATNANPVQAQGLSVVTLQVGPGTLTLNADPTAIGSDGAIRRFFDITPGNLPSGSQVPAPSINTTYTANYDVYCYYVGIGVQPANSGSYSVELLAGEKPYLNAECYTPGSVLAINAFPKPGFQFVQWIGDAAGSAPTTVVTVTKALSITAILR